jgi:hypothetical protein
MPFKTRIVNAFLASAATNSLYFGATLLYIAYATWTQTPRP